MMKEANKIDLSKIPGYQRPPESAKAGGPLPLPYLDINGEIEPTDFLFTLTGKYGIIARGNLHTLQGTKKAGKSAAGLVLIVSALKGEFLGIECNTDNPVILWADTEQDKATLQNKARAVLSMAGIEKQPERLKVLTFRGYGSPAEVLAATLQAIADNTPDLVFLDGVVDLCQAFNDEEESREVVRKLEAYAERYGSAILGLIHTNKHDNEARGHLGAIMQQKSAEIYQVNKEGNTAEVSQVCSRFAPVPPFSFSFADDFKVAPAAEALSRARAEMQTTFGELFKGKKRISSTELKAAYKEAKQCKDRKAETDIKAAKDAGILFAEKEGKRVWYSLYFPFDFADESPKDNPDDYI